MERELVDNVEDEKWEEEEETELDNASFVCEDCDYRWEEAAPEEPEAGSVVCPMCGSTNVTQL